MIEKWTPEERSAAESYAWGCQTGGKRPVTLLEVELACQRNRALAALRRVRFICSNEGHAPCRSGGISEGEVCANFCGCEWPEEIIPIVDTAIAACEGKL
jgi:hypothetical protein